MSDFYTLWTDAGLQQIGASIAQDKKFTMPTAVVGDGGGNPVIPTKGMTDLKSPVWEGPISSITQSRTDENAFVYEFAVPLDAGPFTVREVGLKDESGTLCIVGNFPDTPKPVAADGSGRDMVIRIPVHFENADSISLTVDPLVVASNGDVDRKISAHNKHGESHRDIREALDDKTDQATETKRGTAAIATQDEVDAGESAVKVVVPARLKAWWESVRTWENIKEKPIVFPPSPHTHTPAQVGLGNIPNAISDSVINDSSEHLATSAAVKIAHDMALEANNYRSGENAYGWWEILPDGTIFQGGKVDPPTCVPTAKVDVTFPIRFPNKCETLTAVSGVSSSNYNAHSTYRKSRAYTSYGAPTNGGCHGQLFIDNYSGNGRIVWWFAKGK
ncbi:phage tail protein [Desulfoluna butyratoxydans]|uniref:Phage tail fibre protein n=1 Tax=Desulfoluna butyratoxydans TaxID=231438 RepID=A0A4U8YH51_9BACT|nr:phage tail protein [Desulfoluna butyratoxydans]VFQ42474.1 phage tail fibre protein [Desulfoluna butyratoxydans]